MNSAGNYKYPIKKIVMKQILLGILIAVVMTTLFWGTSPTTTDVIYWTSGYKLTWNDFEGAPNYKHDYKDISAITFSGIVDYRGCEEGKIVYKIKAYFEKKNSWVKAIGQNDHTLEHEQVHFDITELYARKLRNALSGQVFTCGEEHTFETFVNDFLKGWQKMQEDYDGETGYSHKHQEQDEWIEKVRAEMKELEAFKSE
ncbi:MAG: hypothetical protein ACI8P3_000102 [Saprospiraceae bacterium]|jgi:hypothetical protein